MKEGQKKRTAVLQAKIRYYYQCFYIHFVLGICAVTTLFLLLFCTAEKLECGAFFSGLKNGVYDLRQSERRTLSCFLFENSVYCMSRGTMQPIFSDTDNEGTDAVLDTGIRHSAKRLPSAMTALTEDGEISAPLLSEELTASLYTETKAQAGEIAVAARNLSGSSRKNEENAGILFSDQSGYAPDGVSFLEREYPIPAAVPCFSGEGEDGAPLVLIVHTHGTEAYAPDGAKTVPKDFSARSEDTAENVVAVGDVLAQTLTAAGIPVLHCRTMFDLPSYNDSYNASGKYVRETVSAYPSIQYVFDVHRDALETSSGDILRPVTVIGGEITAQVMLVVGTDAAGADHPGWRDNLTVAVHLQDRLNRLSPDFARPINLRRATFNAQYAKGSLLLEIGASGNSLEEACSAAYYLGRELAALIAGEGADGSPSDGTFSDGTPSLGILSAGG